MLEAEINDSVNRVLIKGDSAEVMAELETLTIRVLNEVANAWKIDRNVLRKQLNKEIKKNIGGFDNDDSNN